MSSVFIEAGMFARRHLSHIRQVPEKLMDVTVQPMMFVLLFAYVFGGAIGVDGEQGGSSYRQFLIGGILIQSLTFAFFNPANSIANDLREGVIDRFRSLPIRRVSYLLGHVGAQLVGSTLAISILLSTGLLIGWRAQAGVLSFLHGLALLISYALVMIVFGLFLGMVVRSPEAVNGIGFTLGFPLTFLSNAFVPIDTMPDALQWIASWNPVSVLVQAVRTLFGNPLSPVAKEIWPMTHPVAASWLWICALLAVLVPLAMRRYRQRTTE
jgi:ABC-2 type transport system permease protein